MTFITQVLLALGSEIEPATSEWIGKPLTLVDKPSAPVISKEVSARSRLVFDVFSGAVVNMERASGADRSLSHPTLSFTWLLSELVLLSVFIPSVMTSQRHHFILHYPASIRALWGSLALIQSLPTPLTCWMFIAQHRAAECLASSPLEAFPRNFHLDEEKFLRSVIKNPVWRTIGRKNSSKAD